ncbi:MAG TPA: lysophospholipase [Bacilli bacterium]|nr:lysophospholipase [Bacilli bacterium]
MKELIQFKHNDFTLPGYVWKKENGNYKAIVLIIHGMVEHIARYDNFAIFLMENDFIVYGYDQRGHGLSVQNKEEVGHIEAKDGFKALVNDVNYVVNELKKQYPNLPLFILGHSMGSFIAQAYLIDYNPSINGIILSGSNGNPGKIINIGIYLSNLMVNLFGSNYRSKFIYNLVFGAYNKRCKTPKNRPNWLSRDEKIVQAYYEDEYCGKVCSASFFRDFFKGLKHISKNYDKISPKIPILIISGTDDPVGRYGKGIVQLSNDLPTIKDKLTVKLYPNGRHEMLNEINKEEVYQDILNWLNMQLS